MNWKGFRPLLNVLLIFCTFSVQEMFINSRNINTRLVNGKGLYDGRIELTVDGLLGYPCYRWRQDGSSKWQYFWQNEGRTVCSTLGYSYERFLIQKYGESSGTPFGVTCSDNTSSIGQCIVQSNIECIKEGYHTSALCSNYPLDISDIRLVNGTGPYDGRVELKVDNTWGTVCHYWNEQNGPRTLCRMLNLTFKSFFRSYPRYGMGKDSIMIKLLKCNTTEKHINACTYKMGDGYYCDHGYDLGLECSDCGTPLPPANGVFVNISGTRIGDTATAVCYEGFDLHGDSEVTCQENGIWSVSLQCIITGVSNVLCDCETLPAVEHSKNNATGSGPYPAGTVVQVLCDKGYNPDGNVYFSCNGSDFIGNLKCRIILCPGLDTPTHGQILNDPSYEAGTVITFECNKGYDMVGSQVTLNCRVDGKWSPSNPPACKAKDCGSFGTVVNGKTFQETDNGVENGYGSVVRVHCNEGYILNGSPNVKCQADGKWGTKPTCQKTECPPYPGLTSSCIKKALPVSDQFYILCRDDVSVTQVGGKSTTCKQVDGKGVWQDTTLACYCDCKVETDLTHMTLSELNTKGYVPHGKTLRWSCQDGYVTNTNDVIKCNDGNMTKPICQKGPDKPKTTKSPPPNSTNNPQPISTKPTPVSDNSWVAVVIVVIILLLIAALFVAAVLYLKKKERYCFEKGKDDLEKRKDTHSGEQAAGVTTRPLLEQKIAEDSGESVAKSENPHLYDLVEQEKAENSNLYELVEQEKVEHSHLYDLLEQEKVAAEKEQVHVKEMSKDPVYRNLQIGDTMSWHH